jgi:AbrB family looped-hinge helix DNA binding protein
MDNAPGNGWPAIEYGLARYWHLCTTLRGDTVRKRKGMSKRPYLEARVRIDRNGRILIPIAIRKAMGVKAGDVLFLQCRNGAMRVQTYKQRIAWAQALVRRYVPAGVSLVDELIAERRAEAKREAAEASADDKRHYRVFECVAI